MNDLQQALSDYIAIRRGLGFQFRLPASCLRNFVAFLQTQGATYITTELALRWATKCNVPRSFLLKKCRFLRFSVGECVDVREKLSAGT